MSKRKARSGSQRRARAREAKAAGGKSSAKAPAPVVAAPAAPAAKTRRGRKPQADAKKQQTKVAPKKQDGLSKMQAEMRRKLDGGKFRMLNEQLYTTTGDEAFRTFQDDPALFDVYHQGFREQADKWPVNPLDTFIDYIKYAYAMACGECE